MQIDNTTYVTLDETDCRKAAVNGGIRVDLPPGTVAVVVRVSWQEREGGQDVKSP
jgi:hypothetical protein